MISTFMPLGFEAEPRPVEWVETSDQVPVLLGLSWGGDCYTSGPMVNTPVSPYSGLYGYGAYVLDVPSRQRVYVSDGSTVASVDAPSVSQLQDLSFSAIHGLLPSLGEGWSRPRRVDGFDGDGNCLRYQGYPWVIETPYTRTVLVQTVAFSVVSPYSSGMVDENGQMHNPITYPLFGRWGDFLIPTPRFNVFISYTAVGKKSGYRAIADTTEPLENGYPNLVSSTSMVGSIGGIALNGFSHRLSNPAQWKELVPHVVWDQGTKDEPDVFGVYRDSAGGLETDADKLHTKARAYFLKDDDVNDIIMLSLKNLRQSQFNAVIMAATGKQTYEMVREPLVRMIKVTRMMQDGQWSKLRRSFKKWFKIDRSPGDFAKEAASRELQWQFGWQQLYDDVTEALRAFDGEIRPTVKDQLVFCGARKTYPSVVKYLGQDLPIELEVKVRADFRAVDDISIFDEMSGLVNPSELAASLYDKIPYSFVVDWFYPLTRLFQVVSVLERYHFVAGSISVRVQGSYELALPEGVEGIPGHLGLDIFHRYPLESSDLMPRLNLLPETENLSSWHAVTALALLAQQIF